MGTPLGTVFKSYVCGECGSGLDEWNCEMVGGNIVMTAKCPRGHDLRAEWPLGQKPPAVLPVKDGFDVTGPKEIRPC